jgi:hypothetical protein
MAAVVVVARVIIIIGLRIDTRHHWDTNCRYLGVSYKCIYIFIYLCTNFVIRCNQSPQENSRPSSESGSLYELEM